MNSFLFDNKRKIISVLALASIAIGSLIYTQFIINKLMEQERVSVSLWAKAIEYNSRDLYPETRRQLRQMAADLEQLPDVNRAQLNRWQRTLQDAETELSNAGLEFVSDIIIDNRSEIPSIVLDSENQIVNWNNIEEHQVSERRIREFASQNPPITIPVLLADGGFDNQYVFYGQSAVIQSLKFFPFVQFGLITIFLGLIYANLRSIRRTEQSNLWVGMAKEAAHQLGTPLSSIYGWIELLRAEAKDQYSLNIIHDLEEDVRRLQNVAERFNKIGSGTELKIQRIEPILLTAVEYIEKRLPQFRKNVQIKREISGDLKVPVNGELFTWAVENLMKNALDAIDSNQDNAFVEIRSFVEENQLIIEITDSGKGIERRHFEDVFRPGYSTKKRGWGLGLSLTRRIIEDYHKGKVYVYKSVPGEGTTFRLEIPIDAGE